MMPGTCDSKPVGQTALPGMQSSAPLFPLGVLLSTPGALELLNRGGVNPAMLIARHVHGDFGQLDASDVAENMFAVDRWLRILSAYEVAGEKVWIITEADRSATTLLLPSEY